MKKKRPLLTKEKKKRYFSRISKYAGDRLHAEIGKEDRDDFENGDPVEIIKL